jgi:hypothetical protein
MQRRQGSEAMKYIQNKILILFVILAFNSSSIYSQSASFAIDTTFVSSPGILLFASNFTYYPPVFSSRENVIDRGPYDGDTSLIQLNTQLLKRGPDYKTYETYVSMAAAFWRAGKSNTAKRMFQLIEQSKELYYTGTQFHSAENTYEYGSYTSNYKNEASLHLCKIYIEEKNYPTALLYLIKADKRYRVRYNCGTGSNAYAATLNSLYVICYMGLNRYEKVIDLYLRENFYHDKEFVRIINHNYSSAEIKRYLNLAIDNITITIDPFPTTVYTIDTETNEDSLSEKYYSGNAKTVLFGRLVNLPKPNLKNGETIRKEHFVTELLNSEFYTSLLSNKKLAFDH